MQTRSRDLHYLAKTLLLAIPAISIGIQLSTWISFAFGEAKNRLDFLAYKADFFAYYEAGHQLRIGQISAFYHQIYPPWFGFIHPAYEALLFVPLSFLAPRIAYAAWVVVEVVIVGVILRILWRELDHLKSASPMMPMALTLAFFPVSYAIAQGQDSLLLALLLVLAFTQMKSRNEYYAGLLLGLGVFRFQILLPMAVLFLLWKSWGLVAGIFTSATAALCASAGLTGIAGQLQYLRLLRLLAEPQNQYARQMPNLRGVLAAFGVGSGPLVLIVSALTLVLVALMGRKLSPSQAFLFAVAAGCGLSYHTYLHDFSLLLLPLLVLGDLFVERTDYLGLSFLGVMIVLPITTIMVGSINALWVCAFIPASLMFLLRFRHIHQVIEPNTPVGSKFQTGHLLEAR